MVVISTFPCKKDQHHCDYEPNGHIPLIINYFLVGIRKEGSSSFTFRWNQITMKEATQRDRRAEAVERKRWPGNPGSCVWPVSR